MMVLSFRGTDYTGSPAQGKVGRTWGGMPRSFGLALSKPKGGGPPPTAFSLVSPRRIKIMLATMLIPEDNKLMGIWSPMAGYKDSYGSLNGWVLGQVLNPQQADSDHLATRALIALRTRTPQASTLPLSTDMTSSTPVLGVVEDRTS